MDERTWFYAYENQAIGPVRESGLIADLRGSRIPWDTLVWTSGMQKWRPASTISVFSSVPHDDSLATAGSQDARVVAEEPDATEELASAAGIVPPPVTEWPGSAHGDPANSSTDAAPTPDTERARSHHLLRANRIIAEQHSCPRCGQPFVLAMPVVQCDACDSYHHDACWAAEPKCGNPSCGVSGVGAPPGISATGSCPQCCATVDPSALKCKNCGATLMSDIAGLQEASIKGNAPGAVSALVWGIIGLFVLGPILGWVAISKGRSAIRKIDQDPRYGGRGLAVAGIVMGVVAVAFWVIGLLIRASQ